MKRLNIRLQPIMSLRTGQLYGYEVLSALPAEINIAKWFEQYDSAELLRLREWQLLTLARHNIIVKLFVNLTTAILASKEGVSTLLKKPLPGVIELQDPAAIARLDASELTLLAENIRQLQHAGMEVWLDDYLSDFRFTLAASALKFDGVKLDCKAFQQYRNDSAGLARIINEARRFGRLVLTEGVESPGDVRTAWLAGADLAQGYYWSEKKIVPVLVTPHADVCVSSHNGNF